MFNGNMGQKTPIPEIKSKKEELTIEGEQKWRKDGKFDTLGESCIHNFLIKFKCLSVTDKLTIKGREKLR